MGFDEEDITILKQMFAEQSRDLRDYVDNRFTASERRQDEKLAVQKQEIIDGVSESLDIAIQPKLEDHELRIAKIEETVHTS